MKILFILFINFSILLSNPLENFLITQDNSENNQIKNSIEKNNYADIIIKNTIEDIISEMKKKLLYGMTLKKENELLYELKKLLNTQENKTKINNEIITKKPTNEEINIIKKHEQIKLIEENKKEIENIINMKIK